MKKLATLFKNVDQELFRQVDYISTSSPYQKLIDQLAPLTDDQRKWLGYSSTLLLFLLPFIVLMAFWYNNYSLRQDIQLRQTLIDKIQQFNRDYKVLSSMEKDTVSRYKATSKAEFNTLLTKVVQRSDVDLSNVTVAEFANLSSASTIHQNQIKLNFTHFTLQDLSGLLESLLIKARVKISQMDLKTDMARRELSGTITILHFSRGSNN
jgi:hypothetical protein